MASAPFVTIMIATRNRRDELLKTLEECRRQTFRDFEIRVVDDGSTDGTYEAVRESYPQVSIERNLVQLGSVPSRNRILRRALGKYVLGLDDDSWLVEDDGLERAVTIMNPSPEVGIVAFQVIGPEFHGPLDPTGWFQGCRYVSTFGAGAFMMRRELTEQVGWFPDFFDHGYEEPDYALRCWDKGYAVLRCDDIRVFHAYSPLGRSERRTHFSCARNELSHVLMRYPWNWLPAGLAWKAFRLACYAFSRKWLLTEVKMWLAVLWRLPISFRNRAPVRPSTLRLSYRLNRENISTRAALENLSESVGHLLQPRQGRPPHER